MAAADVFAFPSTKEGFGLAAMEALAAGVPVVVRDLPVLREVFGDAVRYASDAGPWRTSWPRRWPTGERAAPATAGAATVTGPSAGWRDVPSPAGTAGTTSPAPTSPSTRDVLAGNDPDEAGTIAGARTCRRRTRRRGGTARPPYW